MKRESAGLVETQLYTLPEELHLEHGGRLVGARVAYETYGKLNREFSNAILVCHALSGDAHAGGWHKGEEKPGWWDIIIGPGKALDTDKFFVICSNVLGGCKGTTGPSSINPNTGKPYGLDFPFITVKDMVDVQKRLLEHLGVNKLFAVIGGSFGGMQVLQWCASYPEMVRFAVPIATSAYSSPQQIAFNEVGRRAITSDPCWENGNYYGRTPPARGLSQDRTYHISCRRVDASEVRQAPARQDGVRLRLCIPRLPGRELLELSRRCFREALRCQFLSLPHQGN